MNPLAIVHIIVALVIIGVSLPLVKRKIKRNQWYGIRIPEAFKSEERWLGDQSIWRSPDGEAGCRHSHHRLRQPDIAKEVLGYLWFERSGRHFDWPWHCYHSHISLWSQDQEKMTAI
jgi:hypothetical protein